MFWYMVSRISEIRSFFGTLKCAFGVLKRACLVHLFASLSPGPGLCTTAVLASDRINPGLKALKSTMAFQGDKSPSSRRNDYLQL